MSFSDLSGLSDDELYRIVGEEFGNLKDLLNQRIDIELLKEFYGALVDIEESSKNPQDQLRRTVEYVAKFRKKYRTLPPAVLKEVKTVELAIERTIAVVVAALNQQRKKK